MLSGVQNNLADGPDILSDEYEALSKVTPLLFTNLTESQPG
jgi:hypothetical protein